MTDYNVLDTIRNEIQAEHTLISHRMTWYVASQAFLMTAYATAWNYNHQWTAFFAHALPILGVLLSTFAWFTVFSAFRVQCHTIKTQGKFIAAYRARLTKASDTDGIARLDAYEETTASGRASGTSYHWLAMIPPLMVPLLFATTWIVSYSLKH